jgi:uncharacterized Zn-binding protein involved in type VI secretion
MSGAARLTVDKAGSKGTIISAAKKTLVNNLPAARVGDMTKKHGGIFSGRHRKTNPIVEGSSTVVCEYQPMSRAGHKVACGCTLNQGSSNVVIGG